MENDALASDTAKNLLLVLFSTLLTLVLLVGGYEIYKSHRYDVWKAEYERSGDWYGMLTMPSPNPVLMWEYRPDAQTEKWGSPIKTNAHGYRDRNHPLVKDEGGMRVAFVGDSVTLGIGVDLEKTFFRRFEGLSREKDPAARIETLGFAVDGYNAIQVMEMVRERVLPFRPDMVVYTMCMNDFDLAGASAGKTKYFRKPGSFFLARLEKLYRQFFEYHDYHFRRNRDEVTERILQTGAILAERGARLVVVLLPIFPEKGFTEYPIAHMHAELTQRLSQGGIEVVDLLSSPLTRDADARNYARDIWHLTEQGHDLVASLLVDSLLAKSLP
jgi:lysophospholipase L1-like esterase